MVELGLVDIAVEVSQLSLFLSMPHKGYVVSALHIMSYLRINNNSRLVLDPSYADINLSEFKSDENWTAFYGYSEEAKPHNAPKPLGKEIELKMFVNSSHVGDNTNSCSRTGYMIFMNMSIIAWNNNRQTTTEGAVFGAEFVAMKQGSEALRVIKYKLRMMGV